MTVTPIRPEPGESGIYPPKSLGLIGNAVEMAQNALYLAFIARDAVKDPRDALRRLGQLRVYEEFLPLWWAVRTYCDYQIWCHEENNHV